MMGLLASSRGGAGRLSGDTCSTEAYRRLSVRVIDQALRDIAAAPGLASDSTSARAFLSGSPMLDLWCEVAALDPSRIVAYAERLLEHRASFNAPARRRGGQPRAEGVKVAI
jgi:hypothetical protein